MVFHGPPQIQPSASIIYGYFLWVHSVLTEKITNFFSRPARGKEAGTLLLKMQTFIYSPCIHNHHYLLLLLGLEREIWGSNCSSLDFWLILVALLWQIGLMDLILHLPWTQAFAMWLCSRSLRVRIFSQLSKSGLAVWPALDNRMGVSNSVLVLNPVLKRSGIFPHAPVPLPSPWERCDCASSQASGRGSGTWEQSCPPEEPGQAQPWEKPQLTHKCTCDSAHLQTCQQLYATEVVWLLHIFIVRIPNNAPHSSNTWGSLGAWGGWKYHLFSLCHPSSFQTFTTSHSSEFHVSNFVNISHSFSPSQSLFSSQFLPSLLLYCHFGWLFQCWRN